MWIMTYPSLQIFRSLKKQDGGYFNGEARWRQLVLCTRSLLQMIQAKRGGWQELQFRYHAFFRPVNSFRCYDLHNPAMRNTHIILSLVITIKEGDISYVYWNVHHLDSWIKRDQLDVTCFIVSVFNAQHVSGVNTSTLRSLRLICWVISWVVLFWFDVCWCCVVVWLGWCGILKQAEAHRATAPQHIPTKYDMLPQHLVSNTNWIVNTVT